MSLEDFERDLSERLAQLDQHNLRRELRWLETPSSTRIRIAGQGRTLLNFSSNDYLGLAGHPALKTAAAAAIRDYGAGSGASRLICGSLPVHHRLEEILAGFKGTEAALAFSSGYTAALGALTALMSRDDVIVIDRLAHACIIDAVRLSGAKLQVFAHNDPESLERILRRLNRRDPGTIPSRRRRILVVTESVFSMDGDLAPLRELVEVKDRYGAWLMVDEAHATGLYGSHRRGLAEAFEVADRIEVQMGTLSKALGASGGYLCGSKSLIDWLANSARPFIFTTAPVPASAAAAAAALGLVQSSEGSRRCDLLWQRVARFAANWPENGGQDVVFRRPPHLGRSAIVPMVVGDEAAAIRAAQKLLAAGIFVPAIRYPTVARGQARLRITLSAAHVGADVEALLKALRL